MPHLCKELLLNLYFVKERHGLYRDFRDNRKKSVKMFDKAFRDSNH